MPKKESVFPENIQIEHEGTKGRYIREDIYLDLARSVKHLRRLQTKYFATRDRGVLDQAKRAEGELDFNIDKILTETPEAPTDDIPW